MPHIHYSHVQLVEIDKATNKATGTKFAVDHGTSDSPVAELACGEFKDANSRPQKGHQYEVHATLQKQKDASTYVDTDQKVTFKAECTWVGQTSSFKRLR